MPSRLRLFTCKIAAFLVLLVMGQSCLKSTNPGLPVDVVNAIAQTGHNRVELTKTIGFFLDEEDSIYLKSAFFLIGNIPHHYAVTYLLKDKKNQEVRFNPDDFASFDAIESWWNSQQTDGRQIHYETKKFSRDRDTITADLLISTIIQAVKSQSNPWCQSVSTEDFYQYVLPYRFMNENIYDWRTEILTDFSWITDSAGQHTSPDEIIQLINDFVNSNYHFDKRFLRAAAVQTYAQLKSSKRGNQRDLSLLKASIARSYGIPATIDYVPYLADSAHGLYFAVAKNSKDEFIPLLPPGGEGIFKANKIPKVYRRIFMKNDSSLFSRKELSLKTPPYLGHYHHLDVSRDYIAAETIHFPRRSTDTLYYIGVFNDKKWRAVDWTISKRSFVSFHNMGREINYQLLILKNDTLLCVPST